MGGAGSGRKKGSKNKLREDGIPGEEGPKRKARTPKDPSEKAAKRQKKAREDGDKEKRPRGRPPKARESYITFKATAPAVVKEGEAVAFVDVAEGGLKLKLVKDGQTFSALLPLAIEA